MARKTREEAIAIIRKEYQCVDRDCDIERSCSKCDLMMPNKEPILKAYKVAIKALEQEPILDKIIAEMEELIEWHDCPIELDNGNDAWYCEAVKQCMAIIDKYRQEG